MNAPTGTRPRSVTPDHGSLVEDDARRRASRTQPDAVFLPPHSCPAGTIGFARRRHRLRSDEIPPA